MIRELVNFKHNQQQICENWLETSNFEEKLTILNCEVEASDSKTHVHGISKSRVCFVVPFFFFFFFFFFFLVGYSFYFINKIQYINRFHLC
jgi:hypothetical protein